MDMLARLVAPFQKAFEAIDYWSLQRGTQPTVLGGPQISRDTPGKPLRQDWDYATAVEAGYWASIPVYRAIAQSSVLASGVPWTVETLGKDGKWQPALDHALREFIDRPNPSMSGEELRERWLQTFFIGGNGLLRKVILATKAKATGATLPPLGELWALIPVGIKVVAAPDGSVASYVFENRSERKVWPAEEIVHMQAPDPLNAFWGSSALRAGSKVVDTDSRAVTWNMDAMENRTITDGVFTTDQALADADYETARTRVREQHSGPRNAHAPWVLGSGFKWQEMGRNALEMDFVNSRKMFREELLSLNGMPPVVAGYFDQATLANAEVSRKLFWVDFLVPVVLGRMRAAFNRGVVPHFGDPQKLRLSYDLSGVEALQENTLKKAIVLHRLVAAGVPYNEALATAKLNLPTQPGGDVPFGVWPPAGSGSSGGASIGRADLTAFDNADSNKADVIAEIDAAMTAEGFGGAREHKAHVHGPASTKRRIGPVQVKLALSAQSVVADFDTLASDYEAKLRGVFQAVVAEAASDAPSLAILALAVDQGDTGGVLRAMNLDGLQGKLAEFETTLEQAIRSGGDEAMKALRGLGLNAPAFEVQKAETEAILRLRKLIPQLVETTRTGVTEAMGRVLAMPASARPPAVELAQVFRECLGLNGPQVKQVMDAYLSMREAGSLHAQRAVAVATKLARGLAADRAATIGLDNALRAVKLGQSAAWAQAQAAGAFAQAKKTWVTSMDEKVCPLCLSMEGQTVDVQDRYYCPLDGQHYDGPDDPPHPADRCGQLIEITV